MEIKAIWMAIMAAVAGISGLLGWSHKALRQRLTDMEIDLHKKPGRAEIRMLMSDKLAPIQVEYQSLSLRIEEIKKENHKINEKMDRLLVICGKLAHDKD